uniref:SH3 domain-containing protein n=1 Tax=Callorhinchus milii TaxID=7868 RepID=A0A4W3GJC3_CALMI
MASTTGFIILLVLFLHLVTVTSLSDLKTCADPQCARLLNRVQASMDYKGPDCRYLTYKSGESIDVYWKLSGKRNDLWAGSIGKQFGYFPKDTVQVEEIFVSSEEEFPTEESDFLCLHEGEYFSVSDPSSGKYGESSLLSQEKLTTERHESEHVNNNADDKGNSANDEFVDSLVNLSQDDRFQRAHRAIDGTELGTNYGKEQIQKSVTHSENTETSEFISSADHPVSEESDSKLKDDNEPSLITGAKSVNSGAKIEQGEEEFGAEAGVVSESVGESKLNRQTGSNWVGSRIIGWFGFEDNPDEKPVEPTDQPLQVNSFKSRKLALDDAAEREMSEAGREYAIDQGKAAPDSENSGWLGLSKLLSFTSGSSDHAVPTHSKEKPDKHDNADSYSINDSPDQSDVEVTDSEGNMPRELVSGEFSDTASKPPLEGERYTDGNDEQNPGSVLKWFGNRLGFGQRNEAKQSDSSEEAKPVAEENAVDDDSLNSWSFGLNTLSDALKYSAEMPSNDAGSKENAIDSDRPTSGWFDFGLSERFGFGESDEDQTSTTQDETKNIDEENKAKSKDGSKMIWFFSSMTGPLEFDQIDEDQPYSGALEETEKVIDKDIREHTIDTDPKEGFDPHQGKQAMSKEETKQLDSSVYEDIDHSVDPHLCTKDTGIDCQSTCLQESTEKGYKKTQNENPQSLLSTIGLENSLGIESRASKLQDVNELNGQNVESMHEKLHDEEQCSQKHLVFNLEFKQCISDHSDSPIPKNVDNKKQNLPEQYLSSSPSQQTFFDVSESLVKEKFPNEKHMLQEHHIAPDLESKQKGEQIVINSGSEQFTITNVNQHLAEEDLNHAQKNTSLMSTNEQHNDKILPQKQAASGEVQHFNTEFDATSHQAAPSAPDELHSEGTNLQGEHLTDKDCISDHCNHLLQKVKEQFLEETILPSAEFKHVPTSHSGDSSLAGMWCAGSQRAQEEQMCGQEALKDDVPSTSKLKQFSASDHTVSLSHHEKKEVLLTQHLTSNLESNLSDSDYTGTTSHQTLPEAEQNINEHHLSLTSQLNEVVSDVSQKKIHDIQDLQQHPPSSSESDRLTVSDSGKHVMPQELQETLQANVSRQLQSEQFTSSDKDQPLFQEKGPNEGSDLQAEHSASELESKLLTVVDNSEQLLQDRSQPEKHISPDDLSSSLESIQFIVTNGGAANPQEHSFYPHKKSEEHRTGSETNSAAIEPLSQEGIIESEVSVPTEDAGKQNSLQQSMEHESLAGLHELVDAMVSENMHFLGKDFVSDDDTEFKDQTPEPLVEAAPENHSYSKTDTDYLSEKATQPPTHSASTHLGKDNLENHPEKPHENEDIGKSDVDAASENVDRIISASEEIDPGNVADRATPTSIDAEPKDHQAAWTFSYFLEKSKHQLEKLSGTGPTSESTDLFSDLTLLMKQMTIEQIQYLEKCLGKTKLSWLENIFAQLENETSSDGYNDIMREIVTFEDSVLKHKDTMCRVKGEDPEDRTVERQYTELTDAFQNLQDILAAIKMKYTTNVSNPSTKDTYSSGDISDTGLHNSKQKLKKVEDDWMWQDVQLTKEAQDINSELAKRQELDIHTLKQSMDQEKVTISDDIQERTLENQLYQDAHNINQESNILDKTDQAVVNTQDNQMLSQDFSEELGKEPKTTNVIDGMGAVHVNEQKRNPEINTIHTLGKKLDVCVQFILAFIDHFIENIGSRRYLVRERRLAAKVAELLDEKCKVLETLSDCEQKYNNIESSLKNFTDGKETAETRTLNLQDTYAKLDKSNGNLRQAVEQFTQELETEKRTRIEHDSLITEIQTNLNALETEAHGLKIQVEEAKSELKGIQSNDTRRQESLQAAKEENYHLKQSKEQLLQEAEGWGERHSELTEQIKLCAKSQKDMKEILENKDNQVKSLTDCLLKLRVWNSEEGDNPTEGNGWDKAENKTENGEQSEITEEEQKQKIEKLIFVAKLNASLKSVEEERNHIHSRLSDEIKAKQELTERIEKLQLEQSSVQSEKSHFQGDHKTLQQKLKLMTEMYHEKEMELQRKVTLEENQRVQKEEKLSEADQKFSQAAEELSCYRQRSKDLEEELVKTIQCYKNQIASHEKKAHDNWLSAREADREHGNIKRENIHLRQKITEAEFTMDLALKEPFINNVPGRPALLSPSFAPQYRGGSSPYGLSLVDRPSPEPGGFLSPAFLDGPLRFSPLFPGRPDFRTKGPTVNPDQPGNENMDSASDRMSDHHGPQSDSGSLSPTWERERRLIGASPGNAYNESYDRAPERGYHTSSGRFCGPAELHRNALDRPDGRPQMEIREISDSSVENQFQGRGMLNASNQPLRAEAEFGARPVFAPISPMRNPPLAVDPRSHIPHKVPLLPPRCGVYGPPEHFPPRPFGFPPHPPIGMRNPLPPGAYFPPSQPSFLPNRPTSDSTSGLPFQVPSPSLPLTEEHPPPSEEK